MFCTNCGKQVADTATQCPYCNEPLEAKAAPAAPAAPTAPVQSTPTRPVGLTKKDFFKQCFSQKGTVIGAAVLCYVSAVVTFGSSFISGAGAWALIDVAVLLGLGLAVHLARSRVCAIVLTCYGLYNVIFMLITTGMIGGWLVLVAGVLAIFGTFAFAKQWKAYQTETAAGN